MNFFTYIGLSPAEFHEQYVEAGYIAQQNHNEFPLSIFAYSRKTVQENKWDAVTSKCRGIIINRETGEIISRPFEKFHNYGSPLSMAGGDNTYNGLTYAMISIQPMIWQKMDGFMSTLYTWNGVDYVASKGSFHSVHAKWATAWLRKTFGSSLGVPAGYTAVFEGLHRDLRIVVDYGKRQELVLLALINNETGEEFSPGALFAWADSRGLKTPDRFCLSLNEVRNMTLSDERVEGNPDEGFVLTWYQKNAPPYRLKAKFIEYLRLHRMVTGVSPKHVWEVLSNNQTGELNEYLKSSTPWFSAFVTKWTKALTLRYKEIENQAVTRYTAIKSSVDKNVCDAFALSGTVDYAGMRKAYALKFTEGENKQYSPIMFAMLDGKPIQPVIWKMVKPMTAGANPMVDAHNT